MGFNAICGQFIKSQIRGTITPCDSTPFGVAGIRLVYPPFHGGLFTFYPFGVRRIMNFPITNVHERGIY